MPIAALFEKMCILLSAFIELDEELRFTAEFDECAADLPCTAQNLPFMRGAG